MQKSKEGLRHQSRFFVTLKQGNKWMLENVPAFRAKIRFLAKIWTSHFHFTKNCASEFVIWSIFGSFPRVFRTPFKLLTYFQSSLTHIFGLLIQGGSNMTGTVYTCLHTNQSRSYLNHPVYLLLSYIILKTSVKSESFSFEENHYRTK